MSSLGALIEEASDDALLGHDGKRKQAMGQRHDRIRLPNGGDSADNGGELDITIAQRMISATTGSLLTSLLVTPLDVVRVRLQSQVTPSTSSKPLSSALSSPNSSAFAKLPPNLGVTACCREVFWMNNNSFCIATPSASPAISLPLGSSQSSCAAEETQKRAFNSTFDGLRKIARNEGIPVLWRGLSPTLAMAVPANVIYFTGYDWLRYHKSSPLNWIDQNGSHYLSRTALPLVAGSVARILAVTVISPIEMFRTRLQATSATNTASTRALYSQTLVGLKNLAMESGFKSLWRGWSLTVWRDVPFSGFYWWGYETIFHSLQRRQLDASRTSTFTSSFTAGFVSGAAASILTMPFDVGKTRQQTYMHSPSVTQGAMNGNPGAKAQAELGMLPFLYRIFKDEGLPGLWKGWAARTLKVAPACAIMISSYELGKVFAKGSNQRKRGES